MQKRAKLRDMISDALVSGYRRARLTRKRQSLAEAGRYGYAEGVRKAIHRQSPATETPPDLQHIYCTHGKAYSVGCRRCSPFIKTWRLRALIARISPKGGAKL